MLAHRHVRHHSRFYAALLLGAVLWLATAVLAPPLRLVVAGDGFFGLYLALTAVFALRLSPQRMRKRADLEDEGIAVIVFITAIAIVLSLGAIFTLLNQEQRPGYIHLVLSIASVLLGWMTLHTVAAFHYAHLYYTDALPQVPERRDVGGLAFPGTDEPTSWDFLYFSFVVGMTAQVSDVQVLTTRMRRLTLAHGVASFFFNTVILALAVNVAAGQWH